LRHPLLFLIFALFTLVPRTNAAEIVEKRPACRPFLLHSQAAPPYHWESPPAKLSFSPQREEFLVKEISKLPSYGSFLDSFRLWKEEQKSLRKRVSRLECIYFYAKQDTDGDGLPDWQAQIDRRPSAVLFPADDDIDGDGTSNLLDPAPFDPAKKGDGSRIPAHLVAAEKKLQAQIMEKFGILAIDHSDRHSPEVLGNLLFLLEHGPKFASHLKNFRYLYAFSGHDREIDIAAYHLVAKAISIGGIRAFPSAGKVPNPRILSALAHEIGHALLMEKVAAGDLAGLAKKFAHWDVEAKEDLYSEAFFRPHPLHLLLRNKGGREPASAGGPDLSNLVSSYSTSNMHEWFAEAFTADVMVSLGERGLLGTNWRKELVTKPKSRRHHWADYNNISAGLRAWFEMFR